MVRPAGVITSWAGGASARGASAVPDHVAAAFAILAEHVVQSAERPFVQGVGQGVVGEGLRVQRKEQRGGRGVTERGPLLKEAETARRAHTRPAVVGRLAVVPLSDVFAHALPEQARVRVPCRRHLKHLELGHRVDVVPGRRKPLVPPAVLRLASLHPRLEGRQVLHLPGHVVQPGCSPAELVAEAVARVLRRDLRQERLQIGILGVVLGRGGTLKESTRDPKERRRIHRIVMPKE